MEELKAFRLQRGKHLRREHGMCLMEAAAYLGGEEHNDRPECVCPVIGVVARLMNDCMDDDMRQDLLGELPWRLVGTRSHQHERARAAMAVKWSSQFRVPLEYRSLHRDAKGYLQDGNLLNAAHLAVVIALRHDVTPSFTFRRETAQSAVSLLDRMIRLTEPVEQVVQSKPAPVATE